MTTKTTLEQLHTQLDELRSELRGAERKAEFTRLENEAEERNARRDGRMPEIDEWYVYKLEWAADEIRAQIEIVKNQINNFEMEAWLSGGYKDDPDYVAPDDNDPTPAPDGDDTADSTDVATETTPNEHPRAVYELIGKMAHTVDAYDECGAYIPRSMLKSNFPVRKLEKAGYVYLQDGYVYMTVKFWDIWYQTDPASYRQALHYGRISMAEHFAGTAEHHKYSETVRLMQWRIDLAIEPAPTPSDNPPADNDPAPVLAEIMEWVAWNVESFGGDGTYHSVDLLPNINLDGLGKWLRVRNGVVYFRLAWWQLLAQDNPAVYHAALRNIILEKAELSKALYGNRGPKDTYSQKKRRAYRRLHRVYRTVSRYKYGVE